jgi:outer membrane lipoprotein-sorting protein
MKRNFLIRLGLLTGVVVSSLGGHPLQAETGISSKNPKLLGRSIVEQFVCSSRDGSESSKSLPVNLDFIKRVEERYQQLGSSRANFRQASYLAALDEYQESSGEVFYRAPGEMRWHYEKPEEQDFLVKGTTVTLYQPVERQLIVDHLKRVLITELPVSFLLGVGSLTSKFKLVKPACRSSSGVLLELTALDRKNTGDLKAFFLLVDTKSYLPLGAQVVDLTGNTNYFLFTDFVVDPVLSERDLTINPAAGTDLIDRREKSG